ncbi:eukaryotic translation initiation factor 4 gamma 2-like [Paramuricea clavata]|uniref:Eukaryotic translation initiation factor 4 gamma 2-like n=1 Tax=Paramuricea clavata TaxID=317549 RepID=A0A7D9IMN3_PARCT|nr:eukaryotic translation initiation factor 4 gamma 2-like [Paramuricea clavata]
MTTSLAPNVDRNQPLDKEIQDQEKLMMKNMKKFLNDNIQLQVSALYALQVFCHCNEFPKGLLLRMFVTLYDLEIIEEDAFISWKEDVNDQHPGKGRALFQVLYVIFATDFKTAYRCLHDCCIQMLIGQLK